MMIRLGKREVSFHLIFLGISLFNDQRQPRKLIPKGTKSGLCYLVCLQEAWNEIMKTLIFPLAYLSQRSVWVPFSPCLSQHKIWRDSDSVLRFWKVSFTSVSGYNYSLSWFLTFYGQPNNLKAGEQTF
jgi:hypothetical protein